MNTQTSIEKKLTNNSAYLRQRFCQENFAYPVKRDFAWYDVVCLVKMTKNRLARIELVDHGTVDHFNGLEVRIMHKVNGEIDRKVFAFEDWLAEREDSRIDLPNERPHVWAHGNKFDWHIAIPSEGARLELLLAIEAYITAYEE